MTSDFFKIKQHPQKWADAKNICHSVVTVTPWEHATINIGGLAVKGRKLWGAALPTWRNEIIYYDISKKPLMSYLNKIVVHHTNNFFSIRANEERQQSNDNYAALGYHFFIARNGYVYEGRPLEIMGSHAGFGSKPGPLNDPDWGSIGIVLQGDFHHADDTLLSSAPLKIQLRNLEQLIAGLKQKYAINQLLMHREVKTTACPGDQLVPVVTKLRAKLKMKGI